MTSWTEIVAGFGFMLLVGGGFRALLAAVGFRERRLSGEGDLAQARRGLLIYASAAVVGLGMIVTAALSR